MRPSRFRFAVCFSHVSSIAAKCLAGQPTQLRRQEVVASALDSEDSDVGERLDGDVVRVRRGAFDARAGSEQECPAVRFDDDPSICDDDRAEPPIAGLQEGVAGRQVETFSRAGERGQVGAAAPLEPGDAAELCRVGDHEASVRIRWSAIIGRRHGAYPSVVDLSIDCGLMLQSEVAPRLGYVAIAVDRRASLLRVARISWLVPDAVAVWVIAQRWGQPHIARNIALLALALVPLTARDLCGTRANWLRGIPQVVLSLPIVLVVLLLVWQPPASDFAPFLLVLVTARATLEGRTRDGVAVLLASAAVMIGVDVAGRFSGSVNWVLGLALAWIGAFSVRSMSRLLEELMTAQADLADRAAAGERQRIAREIHDVIAHSLSVAALHITGARMAIGRDPEEAMQALRQAEHLARDSLTQVRSVIGVLSPAGEATAPPLPTATDIPTLVQAFAAAGVSVEARRAG